MSHPPWSLKKSSTRPNNVAVLLRSSATSMSMGWWPGSADGVEAVLPWLGTGTTGGVVRGVESPAPQTNLALRPKHVPAQAVAEVHHILVVGSRGSIGR